MEEQELTLITSGRKTGREHRVRLWFAREGDLLWLRTDESHRPDRPSAGRRMVRATPDWYRNLKAAGRARVLIGGDEREAALESDEATDDDRRHLVTLWRAKYGPEWVQDWYVETGRVPVRLRLFR